VTIVIFITVRILNVGLIIIYIPTCKLSAEYYIWQGQVRISHFVTQAQQTEFLDKAGHSSCSRNPHVTLKQLSVLHLLTAGGNVQKSRVNHFLGVITTEEQSLIT